VTDYAKIAKRSANLSKFSKTNRFLRSRTTGEKMELDALERRFLNLCLAGRTPKDAAFDCRSAIMAEGHDKRFASLAVGHMLEGLEKHGFLEPTFAAGDFTRNAIREMN
jgi:hypothetical protein